MYLLGKLTEDLLKQSKFAWLSISIAKPTSLAKHLADGWSVLLFFVAEAAWSVLLFLFLPCSFLSRFRPNTKDNVRLAVQPNQHSDPE
jgi:hypothetical protein